MGSAEGIQGMDQSTEDLIIYGIHPVEEFLKQHPRRAVKLVVREGSLGGLGRLVRMAREAGIPVKVISNADFSRWERGMRFQGVLVVTAPFEYSALDRLEIDRDTILVALDSVKDPHNLGSLLRTAAFFGVKGLILPRDRSVKVTPAVIKTSCESLHHDFL